MFPRTQHSLRKGGIYVVVLGTSMIVAVLGLTALMAQRIQNRMLTSSTDMQQAQLNAHAAVEVALLTMKQDTNWRTSKSNGTWFTGRNTGAGTCSLSVTDPLDANLADDAKEPVTVRGIGYSGKAEQRFDVTIDPRREPLASLRYGVAANDIDLQSDTIRSTTNITASTVTASSSQVYGNVDAVTITGSTYNGTNTPIDAAKRPAMPDWTTVFSYYRTNGTEINILNLPLWTNLNVGRNVGIESNITSSDWDYAPPGVTIPDTSQSNSRNHTSGGTYSLRVRNRNNWYEGATQRIDSFVKPNQEYYIEAYVYIPLFSIARNFVITVATKGSGAVQYAVSNPDAVTSLFWTKVSANITAPSWSGNLDYAYVSIIGDSNNTVDFYLDDFIIRETTTGRMIYRQVLSPSINPFSATNAQGIYWINCAGNKLVIERSRILGTLLVVNPGAGSCIGNGPIVMSPAVAGYPALLVDADSADNADFAINATNRALNERENLTNFNPSGAAHEDFGQDSDTNDIYQSAITGLVAIRDDLTFSNKPLIRGQILVGDDISNSSGTLEIQFQPESLFNPPPGFLAPYSYSRRPISGRKSVLP